MSGVIYAEVNVPAEIRVAGPRPSAEPAWTREVDVDVSDTTGRTWRVPCFWAGGTEYRSRFAGPEPGRYTWRLAGAKGGDEAGGDIEVRPYSGERALYRHGRLRAAANGRFLEHADGTPYLWLADTWWMGFTTRLDWPHGFRELAADRVAKGFNTVQMVAGPLPDYCASVATWAAGQANEGGWPWVEREGRDRRAAPEPRDFVRLNPAFYDMADLRIAALLEMGLTPCIVGMWGYYLTFMGEQNATRHWRNLVARYAAYPVVWSVCGEVLMPTYADHARQDRAHMEQRRAELGKGWSEVARSIKAVDPFRNVMTVHPGGGLFQSRGCFDDDDLLDLVWLHTGHGGHYSLRNSLRVLDDQVAVRPVKPVLNSEVCYEGIMGGSREEIQRFLFWTHMLSGACGHTYGAQGIWAMNSRDNPFDGTTHNWGDGVWQEVMHYPGSGHLGLSARFLRRYPWQEFQRLQAPPVEEDSADYVFRAAGVPGVVRMHYHPALSIEQGRWPGPGGPWIELAADERYTRMFFFNPRTGAEVPVDMPSADGDGIPAPGTPSKEDWVLVMDNA